MVEKQLNAQRAFARKNNADKAASTTTPMAGTNFSKGLGRPHLNPIQVRYLAALHPDLLSNILT